MDSPVRVSVAMGVYNPRRPADFLRAVESLRRQTLPDWELLLYDDGSPPPAAALLRKAAALDTRIRCLRGETNRGLAHALNACIRQARGNYIARLDDDDTAREDRLEKQVRFLEAHPEYQWVGSNALLADDRGDWGLLRVPEVPRETDFLFNSPYLHPAVTFRREALVQSGGYSRLAKHRQVEDYELFMRLHAQGGRGCNLQEPLLRYREDREALLRRTYRRRLREAALRLHGFRALGILRFSTLPYVLKPLLVGALPAPFYRALRRARHPLRPEGTGEGGNNESHGDAERNESP
ncbi:MAG TPA: glycosyltransferase [Firmicutes bacterium]|nr:glycosyltransferase [Bacillota bacterium]